MRELHVRLDNDVYNAVVAVAARRGESANRVLTRFVKQGVAGNAAEDGRIVVSRAIRPVVHEEVNRWRPLLFRTAFDTAVTGQILTWWLQDYLASGNRVEEMPRIIADARKRGAERLRRNAEQEIRVLWPAQEGEWD